MSVSIDRVIDIACILPFVQQVIGLTQAVCNLALLIFRGIQLCIDSRDPQSGNFGFQNKKAMILKDVSEDANGLLVGFLRLVPICGTIYSIASLCKYCCKSGYAKI